MVTAGSGVLLWKLLDEAKERRLSGFEELAGIPGTVGGCLRMNAGAHGKAIGDTVTTVHCVNADGCIEAIAGRAIGFGYREAPGLADKIILAAEFQCEKSGRDRIARSIAVIRAQRRKNQPGGLNAGCIFRNPEGLSAGSLIELAGLKGTACGGAAVSERHANFIVNNGNAEAADILKLIEIVREGVHSKLNVHLELEVIVIGSKKQ